MTEERLRTIFCPHCDEAVAGSQSICTNCGAALLDAVWPLPAGAEEERATGAAPPSDASVGHGFGTGCLLSLPFGLIWFLIAFFLGTLAQGAIRPYHLLLGAFAVTAGIWLAMMLTIYLRQRPLRPRFARGVGYSLVALLVFFASVSVLCGSL